MRAFVSASRGKKTGAKRIASDCKTASEQDAAEQRMKAKHNVRRKHNDDFATFNEKIKRFVESLTTNIQACPGGLWRTEAEMEKTLFKITGRGKKRQTESLFDAEVELEMLRLQVRFWKCAVVPRTYAEQTTVGENESDSFTKADCVDYLKKVWKETNATEAPGIVGE